MVLNKLVEYGTNKLKKHYFQLGTLHVKQILAFTFTIKESFTSMSFNKSQVPSQLDLSNSNITRIPAI